MFTPRKNNRLLDYYNIICKSKPILARANMGLDFVSGQYECLFSRCRKYVINSLIHGYFHTRLVIIPRPMDLGMITRPIWKCPCSTYLRHLEKRHSYWPETKSRPILARAMAWDKVEAHIGPGQYGPRYGNDLVVIQ